jgi:glutaconyl-CoA decarboxylase
MKYKVTVDGTAYVVEVEDLGAPVAPVFTSSPTASAPAPAAPVAAAPAPATTAPVPTPASIPAGGISITSPMPGKILKVLVSTGQAVKNGDVVIVLEAMKMENEIFATADGKITDVRVGNGDAVNAGDVLLVIG